MAERGHRLKSQFSRQYHRTTKLSISLSDHQYRAFSRNTPAISISIVNKNNAISYSFSMHSGEAAMNDVLYEFEFKDDLHTFGKICRELRSSIVYGSACDSATLRLSDICEIYSVDEVMARAVTDTLVSEQYISHRHGNRRYAIEYNVENLKFLSKCRLLNENDALKNCLSLQNSSICDQQLRYKELLHDYQNNNDMSSSNLAYGCALFRYLSQTEFDKIKSTLCGHSKYLRLYWEKPKNISTYLHGLRCFNESCIRRDSVSAGKYLEDIIGKVERYVEDVLDSREMSVLRRYDQPAIADVRADSRRIIRRRIA